MSSRTFPALLTSLTLIAATAHAQTTVLSRSDVPSYAGARAIATADFDGNGWADLAHANTDRDSVTVLLNHIGGRDGLTERFDLPVGHGPFDMVTADFNGDAVADLAVANADADSISILLGRGDGSFTRTDIAAPGNPRGITAADLNRDGRVDLVYTGFATNSVRILPGDGAGRFAAGVTLAGVAPHPQGVTAADFNKDGTLDLAVAYASSEGGLAIFYMNAAGTPSAQLLAGEDNLNVVTTGDFNHDGWQDVAAASSANSRLAIYFGSSTGLHYAAAYSTGVSPRGLLAADVNGDGWLDLVSANRYASTIGLLTARPDAPGSFTATEFAAGAGSRGVVAADFNHDGRLDLATGNQDAASATVLYNDTAFVRAAFAFTRGPVATLGSSDDIIVADINHNGSPDYFMQSQYVLDGTTAGTLPNNVWASAAADFNGDGHVDVLGRWYNYPESGVRLLNGDGTGGFTFASDPPSPPLMTAVAAADMDGDGRVDVLVAGQDPATRVGLLDIILHRSDGSWAPPMRTTLPSWVSSLNVVDLNRDGRQDVVAVRAGTEQLDVLLGAGGGALAPPRSYSLPQNPGSVAIGDVNEDGSPDLVAGGYQTIAVFLGSRTGELTPTLIDAGGTTPVLADMDRDGHLDIIGAYPSSIIRGHGDGTFAAPDLFDFDVFHFAVADMNGDGLPDVLGDWHVYNNLRSETNHAPVMTPIADMTIDYRDQYGNEVVEINPAVSDPDVHTLHYEWRETGGTFVSAYPYLLVRFPSGTHDFTLTVSDGRGGSVTDAFRITIRPTPEIVMSNAVCCTFFQVSGTWRQAFDPAAAGGMGYFDPNLNAPKAAAASPSPVNYLEADFVADPTQVYKLWLRGKAEDDYWGNDSVFVQFNGATAVDGTPVYRIGTDASLAVNVEACANCGLSGWGWRDERWGPTLNSQPVLLRFPQGGHQRLMIQTREDGMTIDQVVLSAERFRSAAPGPAKNDTTIVH